MTLFRSAVCGRVGGHLILFTALLTTPVTAAGPAENWDTLGGAAPFVVSMARGAGGEVWIGTEDQGVFRFDPGAPAEKAWTRFTSKDGLGDDNGYALALDRQGRLWVGHLRHGVSVFDGAKWRNFDVLDGPIGERVFAIACCPTDGNVWIATSAGMTRYSPASDRWSHITRSAGLPSEQVGSIAFGPEGDIYVGTLCDGVAFARAADGYAKWTTQRGPPALPLSPTGAGLPSNLVNAVLMGRDGTVYAGTSAGLAFSSDRGASWRYVRGRDYVGKVHGLYGGAPEDWREPAADELGKLLPEDHITCLTEGRDGIVWIGFRRRGIAAWNPKSRQITFRAAKKPDGLADDFVASIQPMPDGRLLAGTYGGGVARARNPVAGGSDVDGTTAKLPAAAPMPTPAGPPGPAEWNGWLSGLAADPPAQAATSVIALADDWRTQGDWMDRRGNFAAILCGMNFSTTAGYRKSELTFNYGIGPNRKPDDSVRHWIHWLNTDDPRVLQNPEDGGRRQGEWNDHDSTGYPLNMDGPHVYCALRLPAGRFILSAYFFNKDGHAGMNRFRDYLVEVKPTPLPDEAFKDRGDVGTAVQSAFEKQAPGAAGRVGPGFWGGVYKRFFVESPTAATYVVRINRMHSFNTIVSGVFVDSLDEYWGPDGHATPRAALFHDDQTRPAADADTAVRRLLDRLMSLRRLRPSWYASEARPALLALLKLALTPDASGIRPAERIEKAGDYPDFRREIALCLNDVGLFERRDGVWFSAGEPWFNWQGLTRVGRKWNWKDRYRDLWTWQKEDYEQYLRDRRAKPTW